MAYAGGLSAERQVAAFYAQSGRPIVAQRWRGKSGEIDLIASFGDGFVVIEVKRARTHDHAVQRLGVRQMARLAATANEFVALQPRGLGTPLRFDVALVDQIGRIKIIENAFGHD
jgi:putative endonuclease